MKSHPRNGNGDGFKTESRESRGLGAKGQRGKGGAAAGEGELLAGGKMEVPNAYRRQVENRRTVDGVASEAGLTLSHFLTNDALELYYAIHRGWYNVGYISKGWDDPGFRVGEVLTFQELHGVTFIWTGTEIKRYCATNGIGITFDKRGETTEVHLDGVIYHEGFNRATLLNMLESLNACVEKVNTLSRRP
jgi:hypothetical protein